MAPRQRAEPQAREVPGIGPITASALVATIGDAKNFANGRQLAAWLGLVPRQHSSGGKTFAGHQQARRHVSAHPADPWRTGCDLPAREAGRGLVAHLLGRRNANVAAVALANKNARIVWALLAHDREFRHDYTAAAAAA